MHFKIHGLEGVTMLITGIAATTANVGPIATIANTFQKGMLLSFFTRYRVMIIFQCIMCKKMFSALCSFSCAKKGDNSLLAPTMAITWQCTCF